MPPGRRRAKRRRVGYRKGRLSPQLQEAITAEAARLSELEDRLTVVAGVGDVLATLDDALAELALPRLVAVAQLRRQG